MIKLIVALCLLVCLELKAADVPASVMAYKQSGRLASPTNLFYTNLVSGTNIIFENLAGGRLKIHGTGGGGGGSQTPWASDINGNGFSLTNASDISATTGEIGTLTANTISGNAFGLTNINGTNIVGNLTNNTSGSAQFVTSPTLTNAVTNLNIISANSAFTSLLNGTNQTIVKTVSAGSNVTITDNSTNIVIASSNPGGTVTSVGLVAPSIFGVTNSPITSSGNIGFTNVNQTANTVFAGPTSGAVASPAFRALVFADLPALQLTNSIGVTVDGGGSVLTTGQKGYIKMPYSGTLRSATVMADQNGNIVFDVWKSTTFPPTVANTITASAKPTLTSTNWVTDSTLTGWTNSFTIGDYIGWNVDSASTVTRATLQLDISH